MKKIFYLSTCSTCKRILDQIEKLNAFEMQDIKKDAIAESDLDHMIELNDGDIESLFSRRAIKYRSLGLHEQALSPSDMRKHILNEYTFLKRPLVVDGDHIFVGSAKKTVAALLKHLGLDVVTPKN